MFAIVLLAEAASFTRNAGAALRPRSLRVDGMVKNSLLSPGTANLNLLFFLQVGGLVFDANR